MLLCYEVTRDLPLAEVVVETPLATMHSAKIAGKKLVFVPMLRAGTTFVDGMMDLVPTARVAHIGVYRDPRTLVPVEYFFKAPDDIADRLVLILHPMLATGNSAVAAIDRLKEIGARSIRIVCVLATPGAIANVSEHHPDVHIWTAALDNEITDKGYILPGLGDVGDRMFGTR